MKAPLHTGHENSLKPTKPTEKQQQNRTETGTKKKVAHNENNENKTASNNF